MVDGDRPWSGVLDISMFLYLVLVPQPLFAFGLGWLLGTLIRVMFSRDLELKLVLTCTCMMCGSSLTTILVRFT